MLGTLARRFGPLSRLAAAWRHDIDIGTKPFRKELRALTGRIEKLEQLLTDAALRAERGERAAEQVRLTMLLDQQQRGAIAQLPVLLNESRIRAHVERAITAAPLLTEPFDHTIIENLLPDDVYDLLLEARPPEAFFDPRDPAKQDLSLPMAFGPRLITSVWGFVDQTLAMQIIRPAVLQKFEEPLQRYIDQTFGAELRERVRSLPPSTSSGRLALRRPGYLLAPHRDPKRSMLTCLMYLAAPGENEAYGTQLYRVIDDAEADYKQTYFPEQDGRRCELVTTVPFRPNSMLVFLNARGAHGASIPRDAEPTNRYTYQFYIAPDTDALGVLLRTLPAERRTMWVNKNRVR
jgi:hypothetical protein